MRIKFSPLVAWKYASEKWQLDEWVVGFLVAVLILMLVVAILASW